MSNPVEFACSSTSKTSRSLRGIALPFAVTLAVAVALIFSLTMAEVSADTCTTSASGTAWNDPAGWSCTGTAGSSYPGENVPPPLMASVPPLIEMLPEPRLLEG